MDLNNPEYVVPNSPVAEWKRALLVYLGHKFGLRTLVETGTCYGGTVEAVRRDFDHVYSIELSPVFYPLAVKRFAGVDNVHLIFGNSSVELERLLEKIPNEPTLFWIDAHYSEGDCANEGDPIPEELAAILRLRPDSLVLIDDVHPGYMVWSNLFLVTKNPEWKHQFRCGVLIAHRGGYEIPEIL
jgi:hypothetical protein